MIKTKKGIILVSIAILLILAVFGFLYSGKKTEEPISATALKLNTVVQITIYDSKDRKLLDEAMALCDEYEKIFSRTKEDSELYRLNQGELRKQGESYIISDDLAELIQKGLFYGDLSEGAFDISVAPVSALWDFTSGKGKVPDEEEISQAVQKVDYRNILLEENKVQLKEEGMSLDLGAIAKGYIADRIKEFLISKGVKSAVIDLGGNVLCIGEKPDGTPFRIGIQKPFADRSETVAAVEISGRSVVSSGVYERYFEEDGVLYHHILNPKTGYPYENDLISVTVITDQSVDGDGLSTSIFALGLEKGLKLVNSLTDVQAILITKDGEMHFSEGFEEEVTMISMEEK